MALSLGVDAHKAFLKNSQLDALRTELPEMPSRWCQDLGRTQYGDHRLRPGPVVAPLQAVWHFPLVNAAS